jgi:PAS domain S-box-containing protein
MHSHADDAARALPCNYEPIAPGTAEIARLKQQLYETQQTLADAQRLTKTGSWVIDPISGAASCSTEGYRILGLPGKTVSAHYMECLAHVHPDDLGAVLHGFQKAVETGEPRPLQYRIVHPDGTIADIETIAQPMRDDTGRVVHVVGTVMDVTERNRVKDALRASEQLARGQVEALTRTLDALVQEPSTDRLVEPVLRAMVDQLGAHSVTVSLEAEDDPYWREILSTKRYRICDDGTTTLVVPMLIAGRVAGMIAIRFRESRTFRLEDIELAQALANQATLAIELTRLSEQSRQAAVTAERNRMARDVHDTLAQGFTGVILQLEAAEDAASRGLGAEATEHQARAAAMARAGLAEARRSVMALRPQALENRDLAKALGELLSRMTDGTPVLADFTQRGTLHLLPVGWDEQLLRIGQEAVTNALRHAGARRLAIELTIDGGELRLDVRDDGRGFDPTIQSDGAGLAGIRDRVAAMRGRVRIDSTSGAGTVVTATVPLPVP